MEWRDVKAVRHAFVVEHEAGAGNRIATQMQRAAREADLGRRIHRLTFRRSPHRRGQAQHLQGA